MSVETNHLTTEAAYDKPENDALRDVFSPLCFELANSVHNHVLSGELSEELNSSGGDIHKSNYEAINWIDLPERHYGGVKNIRTEVEANRVMRGSMIDNYLRVLRQRYGLPKKEFVDVKDVALKLLGMRQAEKPPEYTEKDKPLEKLEFRMLSRRDPRGFMPLPVGPREFYFHWGDAEDFVWSPNDSEVTAPSVTDFIVLPVGEYGEEFARRLALSTKLLLKEAESMAARASQLHGDNLELITGATARGRDSGQQNSVMAIMHEGIISLACTLSLLTAEKNPNFENPEDFLEAIINKSLPARMAMMAPMGLIVPACLAGKFIKGLVTDEVELSSGFLKGAHEARMRRRAARPYLKEHGAMVTDTGLGCPVGRKYQGNTGIDSLSQSFLEIFKHATR